MTAKEALDVMLFAHLEPKERVREAYQVLKDSIEFYEREYESKQLIRDIRKQGYTIRTLAEKIGYSRAHTGLCLKAGTGKTDVERRVKEFIYGKDKIG